MGRKALQKKTSCLIDNDDMVSPMNPKMTSVKENSSTQHVENLIYRGNVDTLSGVEINYHYGGYFIFSPSRKYVSGHLMKTNMDIDFVSYFDLLDDLKKHCKFDILEGDKFFYLRGDRIINDYDGLVECGDDSDVRKMIASYKVHKEKPIEIYTLSKNFDIGMSTTLEEHDPRYNAPEEEVNEVIMEGHEVANSSGSNVVKRKVRGPSRSIKIIELQEGEKLSVEFDEDNQAVGKNATQFIWFLGQTVRSRSCCPLKVNGWKEIKEDKIEHMWDIILEKFDFEVFELRKLVILGHMSDLYKDYRHKLKKKYFDSKTSYQLRLRNKPKHISVDEWKYLINLWSDPDFQKRSLQNKTNRSKRSLPPYIGTKSYARLRHQLVKDGKPPSRVEIYVESRKRKKGKQVDAFQQDVIDQFGQFKKQQKDGEISLNDDDIFEKVLGTEKNGYLRAYGPGKSISEYFGGRPTKVHLMKQLGSTRKESNERVEEVKREAKEQVEEMKKETDNKLAELTKKWEEKFQMMIANQGRQSNDANLTVLESEENIK